MAAPIALDPRREAFERLGGQFEVRVLEPSPPADTSPPWRADDPVARGDVESGRRVVSPVPGGDVLWSELAGTDADLASWCAERWLGPCRALPQLPDGEHFVETRDAMHSLAEHVLAPARFAACGKIGLRFTRRGFGTPYFPADDGDMQVKVDGTSLVVHRGSRTATATITTMAEAAASCGIEPGAPGDVYTPVTPLTPDAPLRLDHASVAFLGDWYGFAASVLEELRATSGPDADPSRVQLWPEHLDMAVDLGAEAAGARGTFGASPGDQDHAEPYLYVTHWGAMPDDPFWNEEHFAGASLALAQLAAAPDQRAAAIEFYRRGRAVLDGQARV